jgi:hypothetical protein
MYGLSRCQPTKIIILNTRDQWQSNVYITPQTTFSNSLCCLELQTNVPSCLLARLPLLKIYKLHLMKSPPQAPTLKLANHRFHPFLQGLCSGQACIFKRNILKIAPYLWKSTIASAARNLQLHTHYSFWMSRPEIHLNSGPVRIYHQIYKEPHHHLKQTISASFHKLL